METIADSEVKVKLCICPKCKGVAMSSVVHKISKQIQQEINEMVALNYDVITVPLLTYREEQKPWCNCE